MNVLNTQHCLHSINTHSLHTKLKEMHKQQHNQRIRFGFWTLELSGITCFVCDSTNIWLHLTPTLNHVLNVCFFVISLLFFYISATQWLMNTSHIQTFENIKHIKNIRHIICMQLIFNQHSCVSRSYIFIELNDFFFVSLQFSVDFSLCGRFCCHFSQYFNIDVSLAADRALSPSSSPCLLFSVTSMNLWPLTILLLCMTKYGEKQKIPHKIWVNSSTVVYCTQCG